MAQRLEAQERMQEANQLAHQQQMAEMIVFLQSVGSQTGVALPAMLLAP
jgi:hypothetical protein